MIDDLPAPEPVCVNCKYYTYHWGQFTPLCAHPTVLSVVTGQAYLTCEDMRTRFSFNCYGGRLFVQRAPSVPAAQAVPPPPKRSLWQRFLDNLI